MGKAAYQLKLPSSAQIHNIFHVSCLKKAHGNNWQYISLPSASYSSALVEPLVILERRMVKREIKLQLSY